MKYYIGYDIGGTKCAVVLGNDEGAILERKEFPTLVERGWRECIKELFETSDKVIGSVGLDKISAFGVSCGGPLDSRTGVIMCPPNLPDWDDLHITEMITERYNKPARLQNDANACAIAEWKYGAGKGYSNMIFLTFGTGMGAGLILDGRLYVGTNDLAGEVGHIRLSEDGPIGFGKAGSFEGFCSGGGIAQLGKREATKLIEKGIYPAFCADGNIDAVTTKAINIAATNGDKVAIELLEQSGRMLGAGLSILIDILNPELIVIGSVFARARQFLEPAAMEIIEREAIALSVQHCKLVPAGLGESIGDIAAITVATGEY